MAQSTLYIVPEGLVFLHSASELCTSLILLIFYNMQAQQTLVLSTD
jgi:hypothetical protein